MAVLLILKERIAGGEFTPGVSIGATDDSSMVNSSLKRSRNGPFALQSMLVPMSLYWTGPPNTIGLGTSCGGVGVAATGNGTCAPILKRANELSLAVTESTYGALEIFFSP